jgi:hypothetical protein
MGLGLIRGKGLLGWKLILCPDGMTRKEDEGGESGMIM